MITYPLNNIEYSAEDAELFHVTRTSGVYANNSFNYSLLGGNDIEISSGIAWIKNSEFAGKVVAEKKSTVIDMGITDAVYSRIDAVVIQFNAETNETTFVVKQGELATDPVAPEVIRTSSIYELHLYHILRPAGAVSLSAANITDMRLLPEYCGIMADSVTSVDTTAIQQQIDAFIKNARSQTSSFIDEARSETQNLISNTSTAVEKLADETEQKYTQAQGDIDKLISDTEDRLDDIAADIKGAVTTNSTAVSLKDVPSNSAPYAEVVEIGGMTHRVNVGAEEAPEYVLRSAPVTEAESVGVNLFDLDDFANKNGFVAQSDGSYKGSSRRKDMWVNTNKKAGQIFLSYEGKTEQGWVLVFDFYYTDGTSVYGAIIQAASEFETFVFSSDPNKTVEKIVWTYAHGGDYYVKNMMLSFIDTEYTPYTRNTLPIPEAIRNLDGYGWGINADCYNYIDWEKKQFVKRVGCVDLGVISWRALTSNGVVLNYSDDFKAVMKSPNYSTVNNILCGKYRTVSAQVVTEYDKSISTNNEGRIYAYDSEYTDAETFKAAMSGVMLYYELAEPVITDISDLLPNGAIAVEEGGTITMVNEFGYDVPNTIDFYLGKNEVIAANTFAGDLVGTASRAVCDKDGNPISSFYAKYADANGSLKANASGQSPSTSLLRNSKLVNAETNPTVNGEICWTLE